MDGTPLDRAYTASKSADAAVMMGNFNKAADLFDEAAEAFDQVCESVPETASARTLRALASQYRQRSEYFKSGRAAEDVKKHIVLSSSTNDSKPATASPSGTLTANSHTASLPTPRAAPLTSSFKPHSANLGPVSESIYLLVANSAAVFLRTFEEHLNTTSPVPDIKSLGIAPSESFYLVKPKPSKPSFARQGLSALAQSRNPQSGATGATGSRPVAGSVGEVGVETGLGAGLAKPGGFQPQINYSPTTGVSEMHRVAIEAAQKAQREVLSSELQNIMSEAANKEQLLTDGFTEKIDKLRAENDRLRIQVSKLKSRWEDLKESARKRQTSGDQ